MNAGWRWQIGLRDRIGTGYVFSTNYISEEDALKEYIDSFDEGRINPDDCKLIKFNTECYEKQAGTNWITCGLSSGFVEPLESTSIFFMHNTLITFLSLIKQNKLPKDVQMVGIEAWDTGDLKDDIHYFFMWDDDKIKKYNTYAYETFESTVKYVASHYAFNKNNKSKYWIDWAKHKQEYIKHAGEVMNYKQQHLFFSRAGYSLLAAGNELGTEIDGWDLSKVFVNKRQQQAYESGQLPNEKAILDDRTPAEYLNYLRGHLGRMIHRVWLCNMFANYAYDINNQYEWLNHCDELDKDILKSSRNYVSEITNIY